MAETPEITVRGLVRDIQRELRESAELAPARASELETRLSALLGNVMAECRDADAEYSAVLLAHLDSEEAASRAKIRAETTPAYARKREAADTKTLTVELIRSLRQFLRNTAEEMRLQR